MPILPFRVSGGDPLFFRNARPGPRPAEELYDLKEDSHETVNLADNSDHQEILKAMRALVEDWIADTDDKGKYPESKAALAVTKKQFGRWCTDPIFDDVRLNC